MAAGRAAEQENETKQSLMLPKEEEETASSSDIPREFQNFG